MTETTRTMMLIGAITGKMILKKVCFSLAPSTRAASRSDISTPFSPAK